MNTHKYLLILCIKFGIKNQKIVPANSIIKITFFFHSNCGIRDPSWCEIQHFIKFLDVQLESCEVSVFCNEMLIGDVMSGLKSFVVKFMIRMSRDFATSSLQGKVARENLEDVEATDREEEGNLEQYQIAIRRRWERK